MTASVTDGEADIFLATRNGLSIRFSEKDIRPMGRKAAGVIGIRLKGDDQVVAMVTITEEEGHILTATENGFGKRTPISEYRVQSRGGKGVINIKVSEKIGRVIGAVLVYENDEIMLVGASGNIIRMKVKDIRITGRSAQGVKLIRLAEGDKLAAIAKLGINEQQ